jgi:hypothetical protein
VSTTWSLLSVTIVYDTDIFNNSAVDSFAKTLGMLAAN